MDVWIPYGVYHISYTNGDAVRLSIQRRNIATKILDFRR